MDDNAEMKMEYLPGYNLYDEWNQNNVFWKDEYLKTVRIVGIVGNITKDVDKYIAAI